MRFRLFFAIALFSLGFIPSSTSSSIVELDPLIKRLSFANLELQYFIDSTKSFGIDDIRHRTDLFQSAKGNAIFSARPQTVWVSFQLERDQDDSFQNYLLQIGNAHIAQYDFYLYDNVGLVGKRTLGDNFTFDQRPIHHNFFIHSLPEVSSEKLTFYFKIDQEGQEVNFPITIFESNYFIRYTLIVKIFHGLVIGLFLLTSIVTFILYLIYKQRFFLYEVIVSIASILYVLSEEGYGLMLLWPNSPDINAISRPLFISIVVIFSLLFTLSFLKIYTKKRWLAFFCYSIITLYLFFMVACHPIDLISYRTEENIGWAISTFLFLTLLQCALIAAIAFWSWMREKSTDGMVVFLVFTVTFISVIIRLLAIQGLGPSSDLVQHTGFITRGLHIPLIGGYLIYGAIITYRENQKVKISLLEEKGKTTRAIIENIDSERQRISMALHDSAGSIITGIKANLQMMIQSNNAIKEDEHYLESIKLSDQLQQEIRDISNDLLPSSVLKLGLGTQIKKILHDIEDTYKINTKYESNISSNQGLNEKLVFHLYYIIREALDNAVKYSEANEILVQFFIYEDEVQLLIEDNGKGFVSIPSLKQTGHGLKNMKLRVAWLEGTIDIYSRNGASITINVPIQKA